MSRIVTLTLRGQDFRFGSSAHPGGCWRGVGTPAAVWTSCRTARTLAPGSALRGPSCRAWPFSRAAGTGPFRRTPSHTHYTCMGGINTPVTHCSLNHPLTSHVVIIQHNNLHFGSRDKTRLLLGVQCSDASFHILSPEPLILLTQKNGTWRWTSTNEPWHSLVRLGYAVRLDVRVPVLLPAVALPTRLALEGLQAKVLVHVLLEVFGLKELLVTAAGQKQQQRKVLFCWWFSGNVGRRSWDSLSASERTDGGLRLVLLEVFAQGRSSVKGCAARVA